MDDSFGDLSCSGFRNCRLDSETARIQIFDGVSDNTFYQGSPSSFPGTFVFGSVAGSIQSLGDSLLVTIFADTGDFQQVAEELRTEPGAQIFGPIEARKRR